MRRIALSLSALLAMAALSVPALASAATTTPTAAAPVGAIQAMSCVSAKSCIGIGDYTSPVKGESAFLRTWNGAAWGPIFGGVPNSAADVLYDISCTSAKFCVAAGYQSAQGEPLAARWNGTAWTQTVMPGPATSIKDTQVYGVSCASAKFCVAVGVYYLNPTRPLGTGELAEGFIDTWNGVKWAASYKTTPGSKGIQSSELAGISCRSAANCIAVGSTYQPLYTFTAFNDESYHPIALTWNGKRWAASTVPIPNKGHGALDGVSCWSVSRCVAVGNYYANQKLSLRAPADILIAARWNGARWSTVKLPSSGSGPQLGDVSCVSAVSCLAVGTATSPSNPRIQRSLADAWNGRAWRAVAVATPKGGAGSSGPYPNSFLLDSDTCATAADCVAFGVAGPLSDYALTHEFAELYTGSRLSNIADS